MRRSSCRSSTRATNASRSRPRRPAASWTARASRRSGRSCAMNPGRRELLILGGVAGVAAVAGGVAGALFLQSQSGAATLLSSQFPDLSGRARRLSEWQGQPLLCNFWATWCAPCREELPLLDAAQQQYRAQGLQVLGIGIDSAANIREYLKVV